MSKSFDWKVSVLIFLLVGGYLWIIASQKLTLDIDEGIYLEGGVRLSEGHVPYRDFFAYTVPGTYWLQAGIFSLLGTTLRYARVVPILDLAFLTASVYWLTARLTNRSFALAAMLVYFTFPSFTPNVLVNHRLDSVALAMAGIVCIFQAIGHPHKALFFLTGVFVAASAWVTPTLAILGFFVAIWLWWHSNYREYISVYLSGTALFTLLAAGFLVFQGGLWPMIRHMLWGAVNYSSANTIVYGGIIGGYSSILQTASFQSFFR